MEVALVSLGCPRNLVDSEMIVGSLIKSGHRIVPYDKRPRALIVNTCGFIENARRESVEALLEGARLKERGAVKYLIVAGCLAQGYHQELRREIEEVDAFVGTSDFHRIPEVIGRLERGEEGSIVSRPAARVAGEGTPRKLLTPSHYAYLKISEGCDNRCSYCIISRLRGPFRSRSVGAVLKEAKALGTRSAVKELNIIGQDTTMYGRDLYGRPRLDELLKACAALKTGVRWIRLLYTHPAHYTQAFIAAIAGTPKVCKYLDLPVQHASDAILRRMGRGTTKRDILRLVARLRKDIPGLTLRTSVIVGFPGETKRDFDELCHFLREVRFERLGAFVYSREEGTRAARFSGHVPQRLKIERLEAVMALQRSVSEELNRRRVGDVLEVLIDERDERRGRAVGRTAGDAPEVDGMVLIKGCRAKPGDFVRVKITGAREYDLVGEEV